MVNWLKSHTTLMGIISVALGAYTGLTHVAGLHVPAIPATIMAILGLFGIASPQNGGTSSTGS